MGEAKRKAMQANRSLNDLKGDDLRRALQALALIHGVNAPHVIYGRGLPPCPALGPFCEVRFVELRGAGPKTIHRAAS